MAENVLFFFSGRAESAWHGRKYLAEIAIINNTELNEIMWGMLKKATDCTKSAVMPDGGTVRYFQRFSRGSVRMFVIFEHCFRCLYTMR